jgi:hypothetical protein
MCEKHIRRKLEVSYGRLIRVGLVGPKPRLQSVGDGQQVIIPAPLLQRQRGNTAGRAGHAQWTWRVTHPKVMPGQVNPLRKPRVGGSCGETQSDPVHLISSRKASLSLK